MSESFPEKPIEEPVPPERPANKRRKLVENLNSRLHNDVMGIVNEHANRAVTNISHMMKDPSLAKLSGLNKAQQHTVDQSSDIVQSLALRIAQRKEVHDLGGSQLPKPPRRSEITQAKAEEIRKHFDLTDESPKYYTPYGHQRGRMMTEQGNVLALGPDYKVGAQTLQLLGHFSQLFMASVPDMEYECMKVNGRLLVAANATNNIKSFHDTHLKDLLDKAAAIIVGNDDDPKVRARRIAGVASALIKDPASKDALTSSELQGAHMLAEYAVGFHVDHDSRKDLTELLDILAAHARGTTKMLGPFKPKNAVRYIRDDTYKGAVILIEPKAQDGWHAEQSLTLARILAGATGQASVSGTKNPCFFCFHTLSLANQCGYPTSFNITPGLTWTGNTVNGVVGVAQALNITTVKDLLNRFDTTKHLTEDEHRQYLTSLNDAMAGTTPEVDLTGLPTATDLKARKLTQDRSQKSFIISGPNRTEDIGTFTGNVLPDEQRGDWGTPPTSPSANEYDAQMAEFEKRQKAFEKLQAQYEKQQKAQLSKEDEQQDDD